MDVDAQRRLQGSDPDMDEDEIRSERTYAMRKINEDFVKAVAKAMKENPKHRWDGEKEEALD